MHRTVHPGNSAILLLVAHSRLSAGVDGRAPAQALFEAHGQPVRAASVAVYLDHRAIGRSQSAMPPRSPPSIVSASLSRTSITPGRPRGALGKGADDPEERGTQAQLALGRAPEQGAVERKCNARRARLLPAEHPDQTRRDPDTGSASDHLSMGMQFDGDRLRSRTGRLAPPPARRGRRRRDDLDGREVARGRVVAWRSPHETSGQLRRRRRGYTYRPTGTATQRPPAPPPRTPEMLPVLLAVAARDRAEFRGGLDRRDRWPESAPSPAYRPCNASPRRRPARSGHRSVEYARPRAPRQWSQARQGTIEAGHLDGSHRSSRRISVNARRCSRADARRRSSPQRTRRPACSSQHDSIGEQLDEP